MGAPFRFDREFELALPPSELWKVLTRTDDYRRWWPWLRVLEADGLVAGTSARCEIRAPLAYTLRCAIAVDRVEPGRRLEATVSGDLVGPARLEVRGSRSLSSARLAWSLDLGNPVLSRLARVARPAMAWAHDAVVTSGLEQFQERALAEHAARSTPGTNPPKHHLCRGG